MLICAVISIWRQYSTIYYTTRAADHVFLTLTYREMLNLVMQCYTIVFPRETMLCFCFLLFFFSVHRSFIIITGNDSISVRMHGTNSTLSPFPVAFTYPTDYRHTSWVSFTQHIIEKHVGRLGRIDWLSTIVKGKTFRHIRTCFFFVFTESVWFTQETAVKSRSRGTKLGWSVLQIKVRPPNSRYVH